MEIKESKSRNKPTFSSVAAGKREEKKEAKERKSYAQTLKQNNGSKFFFGYKVEFRISWIIP